MKLQLAIVIGAIIVGGAITANFAFSGNSLETASYMKSTAGMMGHLTLTAMDEDGNVIAYRQTDNVVLNEGDNCLIDDTFGTSFSTCANPDSAFTHVHIGTGGDQSVTESDTDVSGWWSTTGGVAGNYVTATVQDGASITVTADFLDVSAAIDGATLQNGALSASDVLALQEFAEISLGPNDDLTIEWTVTIDGS